MALSEDVRQHLEQEALRIAEDSNYSGRGHLQAAIPWSRVHLFLQMTIVLLSAGSGMLALIWGERGDTYIVWAGVLALLAALLAGISASLKAEQRANLHLQAGNEYLALKNNVRLYREIVLLTGTVASELIRELTHLSTERDAINRRSPQIPGWAYKRAKKGIEQGQTDYGVDKPRPPSATGSTT
ncbi:MAG: SLATT domain-containing protein [Chloroflexota bacterium]